MKKIVAMLLAAAMMLVLCGCASSDYKKAQELFEQGKYDEAQVIFEDLEDYEESAAYLEKIQIEKNKLGVQQVRTYLSPFGTVRIEEQSITTEEITFSGTVGEDSFPLQGRCALQNNVLEFTVRFPNGHGLKAMDAERFLQFLNDYMSFNYYEAMLAVNVADYIMTMTIMDNTNLDGSFAVSDVNAFFDLKKGEHSSQHWKYQLTIDENEDFYEITASYLG